MARGAGASRLASFSGIHSVAPAPLPGLPRWGERPQPVASEAAYHRLHRACPGGANDPGQDRPKPHIIASTGLVPVGRTTSARRPPLHALASTGLAPVGRTTSARGAGGGRYRLHRACPGGANDPGQDRFHQPFRGKLFRRTKMSFAIDWSRARVVCPSWITSAGWRWWRCSSTPGSRPIDARRSSRAWWRVPM